MRAELPCFTVALLTTDPETGADVFGWLGQDPDGPLLPPRAPVPSQETPPDEAVPEGAARFTFYAGTTGADEARIPRRRHELAGGLRAYLDLQEAHDHTWRRMVTQANQEAPEAIRNALDAEGRRDNGPVFAWLRYGCPQAFAAWEEMGDVLYRIQMVARMEALCKQAPPGYLPLPDLTFAARDRWDALLRAYQRAETRYIEGKARPSAG